MSASLATASPPFSLPGVPLPRLGSRELFPHLKSRAYLAHAAISPASAAVTAAVQACAGSVAELGVLSFPVWNEQRERLRRSAAALIGVSPAEVFLSAGCTRGITDLALALPWRTGDVLLTYRGEFPANVIPWQTAARARGATVEFLEIPESADPACSEKIVSQLSMAFTRVANVRWVAVSAVQFQTGLGMPLQEMAEVCRRHGARLLVDGIQACGAIPLDLPKLGVDAFFVGAHKWLLGLEGAGFGYICPELMKDLSPLSPGWLSYKDSENFLFRGPGQLNYERPLRGSPSLFEGSTANAIGFAALEAGVDLVTRLSPQQIYQHIQDYHDAIEPEFERRGFVSLRARDKELRSGLLSFRPPEGCQVPALSAAMNARRVTLSIPDGCVRLAPHFANNNDEIPLVIAALDESLSELGL